MSKGPEELVAVEPTPMQELLGESGGNIFAGLIEAPDTDEEFDDTNDSPTDAIVEALRDEDAVSDEKIERFKAGFDSQMVLTLDGLLDLAQDIFAPGDVTLPQLFQSVVLALQNYAENLTPEIVAERAGQRYHLDADES